MSTSLKPPTQAEAYAAALAAYRNYIAVTDRIGMNGGVGSGLEKVAADGTLRLAQDDLRLLREWKDRYGGRTRIVQLAPTNYATSPIPVVTVGLCIDITKRQANTRKLANFWGGTALVKQHSDGWKVSGGDVFPVGSC